MIPTLQPRLPLLVHGKTPKGGAPLSVHNPWAPDEQVDIRQADEALLAQALDAVAAGQASTANTPLYRRIEVLDRVADHLQAHHADLAQLLTFESGKPLQYARAEVTRGIATFRHAAALGRSLETELLPLDLAPGLENRMGLVRRVPIGPVLAITPFNFPLNLVAHKLAPAILAGNAVLHKPASATPLTALVLGQFILDAGWPAEALHVVPFPSRLGKQALTDDRIAMLSFTGSDIGWQLKDQAGVRKRVTLELGGDAAALVGPDVDLAQVARKCALGAFAYAGQICISIQRILVHDTVYDAFREHLQTAVGALRVGDPADPDTVSGPLIDASNYQRVNDWLDEAAAGGARLSPRHTDEARNLIYPTLIEDLPATSQIARNEAFAPLVCLERFATWDEAFRRVNASRYGLQAGLFTHDERVIRQAWQELHVGGIVVNDSPTLRVDRMPYGGVKDSGTGREGTRYAYEEMTEPRLLVW